MFGREAAMSTGRSRRAVLAAASGLVVLALSPALTAQQTTDLPRIAIVSQGDPVEAIAVGGHPYLDAFLTELHALGHIEGETISIDRYSLAADQTEEGFARMAQAVVASRPDLIVLRGSRHAPAFLAATQSIPLVAHGDLSLLVPKFNRPGGNLTGINFTIGDEFILKQLQLLQEAVPAATRIGMFATDMFNPAEPDDVALASGAAALGLELIPLPVEDPVGEATIRRVFSAVAGADIDALRIRPSPVLERYDQLIAELAVEAGLPAIALQPEFADAGLLMTYGPDVVATFRRLASYVDRILAGANPAEMPVEQPTVFNFVLNLRTAEALGITVPASILTFATEFIE
jgi:putative ABC transport system substrate-binding protein